MPGAQGIKSVISQPETNVWPVLCAYQRDGREEVDKREELRVALPVQRGEDRGPEGVVVGLRGHDPCARIKC